MSSRGGEGAGLRETYITWRESTIGLGGIARILHEDPERRAEVLDLHARLGDLLGLGGRGGARVRERWVRCSKKKVADCPTCQASPGHGPYLERKDGKRWVTVEETGDERKARRARALIQHMQVEQEHAAALLDAMPGRSEREGWLTGPEAEAARAEILKRLVS